MDKSINALMVLVVISLLTLFASLFSSMYHVGRPSGSLTVDGQFNIADFPPVINADDFIGDAGDLVTIAATAYDPNGFSVTVTYGPPLNQSGQWQSTVNDSGITYVNITASDNTSQSILTIAIKLRPYCGDGNLTPPEECDDGNNEDGDGCSATCQLEFVPVPPGGGGGGAAPSPEVELPPVPEVPAPVPPVVLPPAPRIPEPEEVPVPPPGAPQLIEFMASYKLAFGEEARMTVQDPDGAPVSDVGVRLLSPTGKKTILMTDSEGGITFIFDETGQWAALIYKAGYQSRSFGINVAAPAPEVEVPAVVEVPGIIPCMTSGVLLALLMVIVLTSIAYLVCRHKKK